MKKLVLLTVSVVSLAGCVVPHVEKVTLIDGADNVRIYRKSDPPQKCKEISPFSVVSGNGCGGLGNPGNYTAAYNSFKNTVVQLGGNAGLIEKEIPPHYEPGCLVNEYVINGVAYKCE